MQETSALSYAFYVIIFLGALYALGVAIMYVWFIVLPERKAMRAIKNKPIDDVDDIPWEHGV